MQMQSLSCWIVPGVAADEIGGSLLALAATAIGDPLIGDPNAGTYHRATLYYPNRDSYPAYVDKLAELRLAASSEWIGDDARAFLAWCIQLAEENAPKAATCPHCGEGRPAGPATSGSWTCGGCNALNEEPAK